MTHKVRIISVPGKGKTGNRSSIKRLPMGQCVADVMNLTTLRFPSLDVALLDTAGVLQNAIVLPHRPDGWRQRSPPSPAHRRDTHHSRPSPDPRACASPSQHSPRRLDESRPPKRVVFVNHVRDSVICGVDVSLEFRS